MWQCPKCKREFIKNNQSHSCVLFPIENHFKNKDSSKLLFMKLIDTINKRIGEVKIESLPCCIHLVSSYTFSGVWILKDRVRMDFRTNYKIKSKKVLKEISLSKNRNLYYIEIKDESDIDDELLKWIKDSYSLSH